MSRKVKLFDWNDIPTLLALLIIVVSLCLFGADSPASSLLISTMVLVVTGVSLIIFEDMQFRWWMLPFLLWWAVLFGVHAFTGLAADGEHEYLMLLTGGCMFCLGRHGALSRRRRRRLFKAVAVFAFLFSMFAFFQHVIAPDYVLGLEKQYHHNRLTGPFLSANTTATFLGMLLLFLIFRLLHSIQRGDEGKHSDQRLGWFNWLIAFPITVSALFVTLTCLLLTASRAGFFASSLAVATLLIGFAFGRAGTRSEESSSTRLPTYVVIFSVAAAGIAVWSLSGTMLETRLTDLNDNLLPREVMFSASWKAGGLRPWLGHGLDNLNSASAMMSTAETNGPIVSQNAAHNIFAEWFAQAGWPGLLSLCLIIGMVLYSTLYNSTNQLVKALRSSLIVLVVAHGIFDYGLEIPAVFLMLSLLVGLTGDKPPSATARSNG